MPTKNTEFEYTPCLPALFNAAKLEDQAGKVAYAALVRVTPDIAATYLGPEDRWTDAKRVTSFATDMTNNLWGVGPAIAFHLKGKRLNGRHRLAAVIKSGKTITMLFIWVDADSSIFNGEKQDTLKNQLEKHFRALGQETEAKNIPKYLRSLTFVHVFGELNESSIRAITIKQGIDAYMKYSAGLLAATSHAPEFRANGITGDLQYQILGAVAFLHPITADKARLSAFLRVASQGTTSTDLLVRSMYARCPRSANSKKTWLHVMETLKTFLT